MKKVFPSRHSESAKGGRRIPARSFVTLRMTIALFIIVVFGLAGGKALFHPGFYSSHDGEHQLVRQYVFEQGIKDGQLPVRFSRQLYNGYGYPLFFFTYRLPFYIGEVFRALGFSFADSIKLVFILTYLLSGVSMFWFAKRWGTWAGFVAAFLYLWAPYRFSVMFVRAALGEHAAAVFAPLLFGSVFPGRKGKINVVLGAAAIAGLFLSHAMMAQIVLLMFVVGVFCSLLLSSLAKFARSPSPAPPTQSGSGQAPRLRSGWPQTAASSDGAAAVSLANLPASLALVFKKSFLMFGLGLGLAAYYLIPAVAYRGLTQKLNPDYFADHFVTLRQLVYSPWGYTFSMKGTENDGMSFQVGLAQWAAVGAAVISYLLLVIGLKRSLLSVRKGDSLIESTSFLIIFFLSIFLMTEPSAFVWNWWKNYINIDMPWRFLLMTTFSGSALAGAGFQSLTFAKAKVRLLVAIFLVGLAVYANRNHLRVNEYLDYPDSRLTQYRGTSNSDNEYRPKWDDAGITRSFLGETKISTGSGQLTVVRSKSNLLQAAGNFDEASRVDLNILYFPGWEVLVDGQKWPFKYAGEGGIIRVDVPAGYHVIEAKYTKTGLMKLADGISIGSLIALIGIIKTLEHENIRANV